jgi:hypothetical protein
MDKKQRIVESVDTNGTPVKVIVRSPTVDDYKDSQLEYNKAFRDALDSGALLRQRLTDYMREQGIWNDEKQKQSDEYVESIRNMEERLRAGGIRLSEAKDVALKLRVTRAEFQLFLAEKNSLDSSSAEGQADNARFNKLVRLCVLDEKTKLPFFKRDSKKAEEEAYNASSSEPWLVEASSELANMLYGLDPNYNENLEENKFLKEFKFVNEDYQFIDKDGHPTDSEGRLVNDDGRYVAYRSEEAKKDRDESQMYFVNRGGEELVCVTNSDGEEEWVPANRRERKPFLDDDDNPISDKAPEEEPKENKKPTRKRKSKVEVEE